MTRPRIALATYSTKPRGGVVHTLALAEALHRTGADVTVVTLGDPAIGFYREVAAPTLIVPAPTSGATLEERIFAAIDALEAGLLKHRDRFDLVHTQDCISARAAVRVQRAGADFRVFRTVHHVDDFTTPTLIDCQIQAILEPDAVMAVSEHWRALLRSDYGVEPGLVYNGVDLERFEAPDPAQVARLRASVGLPAAATDEHFLFLAVGGLEPRKGSKTLIEALALLKERRAAHPDLPRISVAVVGGHAFQDYQAYRDECHALIAARGLVVGEDIHLVGTVSDDDMTGWYHAADGLAFPSTKEGWGLVVLEALAAGLPAITSDLPVFGEYLTGGETSLTVGVDDASALAEAMAALCSDPALRQHLREGGRPVAERFSWAASARQHLELYARAP